MRNTRSHGMSSPPRHFKGHCFYPHKASWTPVLRCYLKAAGRNVNARMLHLGSGTWLKAAQLDPPSLAFEMQTLSTPLLSG